jgi:hypothetical protein
MNIVGNGGFSENSEFYMDKQQIHNQFAIDYVTASPSFSSFWYFIFVASPPRK